MPIRKVLLVTNFVSSYEQGLLKGIARFSRESGPWIFFKIPRYLLNPSWSEHGQVLQRIKDLKPDGVFALCLKDVEYFIQNGVPTIISDDSFVVDDTPRVVSDYNNTAKMAAKYFLNKGFRNFAWCGEDKNFWANERKRYFCAYIEEAGFSVNVYKQPKLKTLCQWEIEQHRIAEWLKSIPKPFALFTCSDNRGEEVCEACKIAGIHVPEECAIMGVDNDVVFCELSNPPLTSIAFNTEKAGYEAAELLESLMSGHPQQTKKIVVHPLYITTRQSTDIFAMEDKEVVDAIRFIRNNRNRPISVPDVVREVALSRRTLERRFRKALNRSIHDEIRRVHVEQIARMISETTLSISQIGLKMGYPDITNIAKYFKRETGLTPLAYRKLYGGK